MIAVVISPSHEFREAIFIYYEMFLRPECTEYLVRFQFQPLPGISMLNRLSWYGKAQLTISPQIRPGTTIRIRTCANNYALVYCCLTIMQNKIICSRYTHLARYVYRKDSTSLPPSSFGFFLFRCIKIMTLCFVTATSPVVNSSFRI